MVISAKTSQEKRRWRRTFEEAIDDMIEAGTKEGLITNIEVKMLKNLKSQ